MDLQKSSTKYSMKIMTIFYRIVQIIGGKAFQLTHKAGINSTLDTKTGQRQ